MKRCRCLVFVFLSFLAFFTAPQAALPGDSPRDALLEKLLQARENWLQNASFYGNYTVKSGSFSPEEEAPATACDDAETKTGFACKLKNKYRRQIVSPPYDRGGETVPQKVTNKIANDRFSVTYWRYDGDYQDDLFGPVDGFVKDLSGKPGASFRELREVASPWWVFTGQANPLYKGGIKIADFGYTEQENGRVLLTFREQYPSMTEGKPGSILDWEITVRTDTEEPLVERTVFLMCIEGEDTPSHRQTVDILEWQKCGEVLVPARFRWVNGDPRDMGKNHPGFSKWRCLEFQFTDLGQRQPTDEDFKLEIRPEDKIFRLKRIPENNIIDIDALTDDDYNPDETLP